jgi:DNA-binding NtrC family response regulator
MTEYQKSQIISKYKLIEDEMKKHNFNKSKTALALGIDRKTIHNILNRYELMKRLEKL